MSKGYAEGPALEERLSDLERAERKDRKPQPTLRAAVFGATTAKPEAHFLGWANEVDADKLFDTGAAFGITLRKIPA
jgi:hypothetical protein